MSSVNKIIIVGNLGADPDIHNFNNGNKVATLSVATNSRAKVGDEYEQRTEWHRIKLFGRNAENAEQWLTKGQSVYVEGRLQTSQWEKDGKTQYRTEIMGDRLTFIGPRPDAAEA